MFVQSSNFGPMRLARPQRRSTRLMRRMGAGLARAFTSPLTMMLWAIMAAWLIAGTAIGLAFYLGRRAMSGAGMR